MKKDLIELIDSRKEIEKMFHPFDGGKGRAFEQIRMMWGRNYLGKNWLQEKNWNYRNLLTNLP